MSEAIVIQSLNVTVREDKDGKPHIGIYWIDGGMVHLSYLGSFPTKSAALRNPQGKDNGTAGGLAAVMLRESMEDLGL